MQNPEKIRTIAQIALVAQPSTFVLTALAGNLNSIENGYNGMQALLVIPIFLFILTSYLIWKNLHSKYTANGNVIGE